MRSVFALMYKNKDDINDRFEQLIEQFPTDGIKLFLETRRPVTEMTSASKIELHACYRKAIIRPKEKELSFNNYNIIRIVFNLLIKLICI